ncbi:MAG TPA: hypothetical protein DCE18_00390, partial [Syntrophobacteraceae bacterium]|nr:hypothetical protein [Syntrophobacteraceae bacterium]
PGTTTIAFDLGKYLDCQHYNAKTDFGAIGDGVADDTAALQAAITAAITNKTCLYLPRGSYKITASLVVTSTLSNGLTLFGDGPTASIIYCYAAGVSAFTGGHIYDDGYLLVEKPHFIGLGVVGVNGDASSRGDHGFDMATWAHFLLERVDVSGFLLDGVHMRESVIGTICDCHIYGNRRYGIYGEVTAHSPGYGNHGVTIRNSEVQGNKTGGIWMEVSSQLNIVNNVVEANTNFGIKLTRVRAFNLVGNYGEGNGATHIIIGDNASLACIAGVISGNNLENASTVGVTSGIEVNNAYGVSVFGNFMFNCVLALHFSSIAHNCSGGPNHTVDPVSNESADSVLLYNGVFTGPRGMSGTWTPVPTSLGGTGITYDARYVVCGDLVTYFIKILGTGLTSTTDVTQLTIPHTLARLSAGVAIRGGSAALNAACLATTGGYITLPTFASTSRIDITISGSLS